MNALATPGVAPRIPWNRGKLIRRKPPLKLQQIWTLRTRLQLAGETRQLTPILRALSSAPRPPRRARSTGLGTSPGEVPPGHVADRLNIPADRADPACRDARPAGSSGGGVHGP